MSYEYENLVFQGGGVKGIAYLGVLDVLNQVGISHNIKRVAGTSAGAISALLVALNLPFRATLYVANTLNYSKIPKKSSINVDIPINISKYFDNVFEDFECVYRLITEYGWYSSEYIYRWLQKIIAFQFNYFRKKPPYTFKDFKNFYIHKNRRPFKDLYITGTDMTTQSTVIFSYENTPNMEVAKAVLISISIPLYFESVNMEIEGITNNNKHVFSDGGIMFNYPLELFDDDKYGDLDEDGINRHTLGAKFISKTVVNPVNNIVDYIESLFKTLLRAQDELFKFDANGRERSIEIETCSINTTDFNIKVGDNDYKCLYTEGKKATKEYLNIFSNI
jgi:NTE family protein